MNINNIRLCDLCRPFPQMSNLADQQMPHTCWQKCRKPADNKNTLTNMPHYCWQRCWHGNKTAITMHDYSVKLPIPHASSDSNPHFHFPTFVCSDFVPQLCPKRFYIVQDIVRRDCTLDLQLWFQDTWFWAGLWCNLLLPSGPCLRSCCSGYSDTTEVDFSKFWIFGSWLDADSFVEVQGATRNAGRLEDGRCQLHGWRIGRKDKCKASELGKEKKNRTEQFAEHNLN